MTEAQARDVVRARAHGRCEMCRRPATNFCHRVGRGQGGLWLPSNGLLLCGSGTTGCHGWTHHERELARRGGWIVDSGEVPADVPVWIRAAELLPGWYLLDDDGCLAFAGVHGVPLLPPWASAA